MKSLGAVVVALAAGVAGAQTWVREPAPPGVAVRDDRLLREIMLAGHNEARAAFGVAPLTWDARLTEAARDYARHLARTGRFAHSTDRGGTGETLWAGSRGDYSYSEMIGHWLAEQRDFRSGVMPDVSRTGRFGDVAHYVQIVWPMAQGMGCALAANDRFEYLVCRYTAGATAGRRLG